MAPDRGTIAQDIIVRATTRIGAVAEELKPPHPLQARMPVLAEDDAVVGGNAGRGWTIAMVIRVSGCEGVGSPQR